MSVRICVCRRRLRRSRLCDAHGVGCTQARGGETCCKYECVHPMLSKCPHPICMPRVYVARRTKSKQARHACRELKRRPHPVRIHGSSDRLVGAWPRRIIPVRRPSSIASLVSPSPPPLPLPLPLPRHLTHALSMSSPRGFNKHRRRRHGVRPPYPRP